MSKRSRHTRGSYKQMVAGRRTIPVMDLTNWINAGIRRHNQRRHNIEGSQKARKRDFFSGHWGSYYYGHRGRKSTN